MHTYDKCDKYDTCTPMCEGYRCFVCVYICVLVGGWVYHTSCICVCACACVCLCTRMCPCVRVRSDIEKTAHTNKHKNTHTHTINHAPTHRLDLSNNQLSAHGSGVRDIALLLVDKRRLEKLSLSYNLLLDAGVLSFAHVCTTHCV